MHVQLDNIKSGIFLQNVAFFAWGSREYAKRILFTLDGVPEFIEESREESYNFGYEYIPLPTYTQLADIGFDELTMVSLFVRVEHPDDQGIIDQLADKL